MAGMSSTHGSNHYDAIVVGGGFGGVKALYELLQRGLKVRLLETGSDVGGTWYWNRYPGVRTDSDAWVYCFSFSKELLESWDWTERVPRGEQVQAYLGHVVDRFDMRRHISFNSRVMAAVYGESTNIWTVRTETGTELTCTYLVSATGLLSSPKEPDFRGMDQFNGQLCMSMRWPTQPVDFKNKRVAIVGSGSTAVQILPLVAQMAGHVSLFQRTPNYVLPSRNLPIEPEQRRAIKDDYERIWQKVRQHVVAFPMEPITRNFDHMSADEVQKVFDAQWEDGAFRFIYGSFADIGGNPRSTEAASEYVRRKIRAIVKDPTTAELLCPKHPLGLKRPPVGTLYYETFNRPNVSLVDISNDPIERFTASGIATRAATYEFDIIILAMGFDAATGALSRIDIRGMDDLPLTRRWRNGPQTSLGIMVDGFPNLFMVSGPHSPGGNIPPIVERTVEWIGSAIAAARSAGHDYIEPEAAAVTAWGAHIQALYDQTMMVQWAAELRLFQTGANIPGKSQAPMFYFGGANRYADELDEALHRGLRGFRLQRPQTPGADSKAPRTVGNQV